MAGLIFYKPKVRCSFLSRTVSKLSYYRKGLPWYAFAVRLAIDALAQAGLRIEPYHLFLEGLAGASTFDRALEKYEVRFLGTQDMRELALIPGRNFTHDDLLRRLDEGKRCLGLLLGGRIAAFTWFDSTACLFEDDRLFPLQGNEACLFDAYTLEAFRGQDLAPYMRYRCYEELAKIGRTRCYSATVLFNVPAERFKKKLGAQVIELWVLIEIFRRWRFQRRLRRYVGASGTRSKFAAR
ncbi:MAG: hypothetical protein ACXWCH_30215 [Burkholderiales bacterium]